MPPPDALTSLPAYPAFEFESRVQELPLLTGDSRTDFLAGRKFVEEVHRSGGSGHTVVRLQSAATDRIVNLLWERALEEACAGAPAQPGFARSPSAATVAATSPPTATWICWCSTGTGSRTPS